MGAWVWLAARSDSAELCDMDSDPFGLWVLVPGAGIMPRAPDSAGLCLRAGRAFVAAPR